MNRFLAFPRILPSIWDENDDWLSLPSTSAPSGLSVSEDANHVYIEAQVPGIKPEDVEVTFDKGYLCAVRRKKKKKTRSANITARRQVLFRTASRSRGMST